MEFRRVLEQSISFFLAHLHLSNLFGASFTRCLSPTPVETQLNGLEMHFVAGAALNRDDTVVSCYFPGLRGFKKSQSLFRGSHPFLRWLEDKKNGMNSEKYGLTLYFSGDLKQHSGLSPQSSPFHPMLTDLAFTLQQPQN
ncbi:hypothetical protein DNTS_024913 [Danionella cerebrum]|uniref:Uncharacterized protein n=1 Tax=Danionella cerebrum TaxID=2873325 RepID=A0A553NRY5_9TELE|nr:hypothetical protein DNTS_024913 [Danionella translucida]